MAARPILAPLGGAFVSVGLIYAIQSSLNARTSYVNDSLRGANETLSALAEGRRPGETADKEELARRTPAYDPSAGLSLKEEIKARWNEHLLSFAQGVSNFDAERFASRTGALFSSLYAKVTGEAAPQTLSEATDVVKSASSTVVTYLTESTAKSAAVLTRSGQDPPKATLRDPVPRLPDPRLWQPNTYYMGQGCNLRESK